MWLLLQSAIIFAVIASNIHWQWTPNGYLVGAIAVGTAWAATASLNFLVVARQEKVRARADLVPTVKELRASGL